MRHQNPPRWQPDAIPTNRGWVHPRTGELLVSVKGLLNKQNIKPEKTEKPVILDIKEKTEVVDNVFVELEIDDLKTLECDPIPSIEIVNEEITKEANIEEIETEPVRRRGRPKRT